MRHYNFMLILFALLVTSVTIMAAEKTYVQDKTDIEQTINSFVKSVDSQNADALEKSMIENGAIVTLNTITNKVDNYSTNKFVDLVKNGQKGGWVRNVNVSSVDVDGNTAMAKVEITDARLSESGFFTLVKEGNGWKIASEVTTLELKNK